MFSFNKLPAKQLKKKVRSKSLRVHACQHMKVIQLRLMSKKTIKAKHNICMHARLLQHVFCILLLAKRTSIGNPQMQGTLHEFCITPDHYHNDTIKDIRSLQRCFLLRRDLSQISCHEGWVSYTIIQQIKQARPTHPSPNEPICMSECTICKSWR